MRVLVISTPVENHFLPLLPLIRALADAGHEILVTGQPDVTGPAEAAGLATVTFGEAFHSEDLRGGKRPAGLRPIEVSGRPDRQQIGGVAQVWRNHVPYFLPDYLELAREWRADLVLSEHMEFAGSVIGAVLGIPSVQQRWGVNPTAPAMLGFVRLYQGPLCTRLGLDSVPVPDLLLDPAPPALADTEAPAARPIRPVPHAEPGTPWAYRTPPGRRVAVALGGHTLELGGARLLRRVVDVLARTGGVEAVVSAAPRHREAIGALPEGMTYTELTAPGLLFPGSDLVVHHGGAGSTLGAAALGIPQLVLPQLGDAFVAGDRIAAAGAGITLDSAELQNDEGHLAAAVTELLAEPGHRAGAALIREQIEAMPTAAEVVGRFEQLTVRQGVAAV
ncbi:nucleotide disphospho-sugar-binding domain-containing protein [Streptomyces sp. NPDC050485]|uniref:nucleotide disphospho-sugar-binding domain-containing protein n=1 Tax=Streptomyces sp. NPDC050485 TaxID=3365617 RepID=UPI003791D2C6